jgi:hypothetical protein
MAREPQPTSKAELRDALDELVLAAYANGVEVDDGAYALRHDDPGVPDWEVLISETTKVHDD